MNWYFSRRSGGGKRRIATLDVSVGAAISNVDQFIFASRARA